MEISNETIRLLNAQIKMEAEASNIYLSMASWAHRNLFEGFSKFLYHHSQEEREHMFKIINYMNDRFVEAIIPDVSKPKSQFKSILEVFEMAMDSEKKVTKSIVNISSHCQRVGDEFTSKLMDWFIEEQLEEEMLMEKMLKKIKIFDKINSIYILDKQIKKMDVK